MSRYFFRVIESDDGWLCRRGRYDIDSHETRQAAIAHMSAVAERNRPSEVIVHDGDGNVEMAASFAE